MVEFKNGTEFTNKQVLARPPTNEFYSLKMMLWYISTSYESNILYPLLHAVADPENLERGSQES